MTYRFSPIGPYALPLETGQRALDYDRMEDAITSAVLDAERLLEIDLEDAPGLYIFSIRTAGAHHPYYVGQACSQGLPDRALRNRDKKGLYDTILQKCRYVRGTPCMSFLPLMTPSGRVASLDANKAIISDAEAMLIGACRSANDELWNLQHNMDAKFEIDGLTAVDRRIPGERSLAELLGLD